MILKKIEDQNEIGLKKQNMITQKTQEQELKLFSIQNNKKIFPTVKFKNLFTNFNRTLNILIDQKITHRTQAFA